MRRRAVRLHYSPHPLTVIVEIQGTRVARGTSGPPFRWRTFIIYQVTSESNFRQHATFCERPCGPSIVCRTSRDLHHRLRRGSDTERPSRIAPATSRISISAPRRGRPPRPGSRRSPSADIRPDPPSRASTPSGPCSISQSRVAFSPRSCAHSASELAHCRPITISVFSMQQEHAHRSGGRGRSRRASSTNVPLRHFQTGSGTTPTRTRTKSDRQSLLPARRQADQRQPVHP